MQLNIYTQIKFSVYLTGFLRNHGIQHVLFEMIETSKTNLNMVNKAGIIYMDLPKVFDRLNHEFLIAKLKCYGLDQHAIYFFRS